MENVSVFLHFDTVGELQGAAFSLIAARIRVRRIMRQVQTVQRPIATTTVVRKKEPSPFLPLPGVVKLELCIGDSAKFGFVGRRLQAVGMADDMNQSMAGVNLLAEHLPEIPGRRAENILKHRREAVFFQDLG